MGVKRSSDDFSHQVKEVIQIVLKKVLPVIPKGEKLVNCRLVKPDLTHLIFFPLENEEGGEYNGTVLESTEPRSLSRFTAAKLCFINNRRERWYVLYGSTF